MSLGCGKLEDIYFPKLMCVIGDLHAVPGRMIPFFFLSDRVLPCISNWLGIHDSHASTSLNDTILGMSHQTPVQFL